MIPKFHLSRKGQTPPGGYTLPLKSGQVLRGFTAESIASIAMNHGTDFKGVPHKEIVALVEKHTVDRIRAAGLMDWLTCDWPKMVDQAGSLSAEFYSIDLHIERPQSFTYNPSIVGLRNGVGLLAYRDQSKKTSDSKIRLVEVNLSNGALRMDTDMPLGLELIAAEEQFEDPRLFRYQDRLFVAYSSWQGRDWKYIPRVRIAEISPEKPYPVLKTLDPEYGSNGTSIQKNWIFFGDGGLKFVYWAEPHEVVLMDPNTGSCNLVSKVTSKLHWDYGEIRGGTPPIQIDDKFVTFFHSRLLESGRFRYYMGAYSFSLLDNGYTPIELTKEPLLAGSDADLQLNWAPLVAFPGGAVLEDGTWHVALGVNDAWSGLFKISVDRLNQLMKPI